MKTSFCCLLVWVIATPANAVTFDEARHLLSRTGFGIALPEEIKALRVFEYEEAVDSIIEGVIDIPVTPLPEFKTKPEQQKTVKSMNSDERKAFTALRSHDNQALKQWWVKEMLATPSPLTERMVMFWSNHCVSELSKVNYARLMYAQQKIFRKNALGNFKTLLKQSVTSPAMLVYLDGNKNIKGRPNENFARELMELFTMGEGQGYTELDIREAARAFTGWRVNYKRGGFVLAKKLHDYGRKSFLGKEGNFDGIDILDMILDHPRVAEYITEKLWREFVSVRPNEQEIYRLANVFRDNDLSIKPLLKAILMSDTFRNPDNHGTLIKSPAELIVGTMRFLKVSQAPIKMLFRYQKKLGQNLFDPPDVNGWPGGRTWVSTTTTLRRDQFIKSIRRMIIKSGKLQPVNMMRPIDQARARTSDLIAHARQDKYYLERLILPFPPALARSTKAQNEEKIINLMLDPVYQLK